jgi:hypothetical protein
VWQIYSACLRIQFLGLYKLHLLADKYLTPSDHALQMAQTFVRNESSQDKVSKKSDGR